MSWRDIVAAGAPAPCQPWPRVSLDAVAWSALADCLAAETAPVLLGLWADMQQVHALLHDDAVLAIASTTPDAGLYPALSPARPAAARLERMIRDLWGHTAIGGDARTWLDHGRWPLARPLSPRPGVPGGAVEPPVFAVPEPGVMQLGLGPVRGLIEEPAHLRLWTTGDTVLRAEARLGYAHKGIIALMRGKSPRAAARFVARLAAEATVAHAIAFARAAESALDAAAPPRAQALRAVMQEWERAAGHLDDLGRLADAAGLAPLHAACGYPREHLLRAAERAFGHRLMMDMVVPGGIATDVAPDGAAALWQALDLVEAALPRLRRALEPLCARLAGVGVIRDRTLGGVLGRAAGGGFDSRQTDPAYAACRPAAPRALAGDAAARCRVRLVEIAESLHLLRALLNELPEGAVSIALPADSGEGLGAAESLRGTVWHWLRLDHGQIAAAFPCDPGWLHWPAAEAALIGAPVEEATMIRLSCGLPSAGLDL